MEQSSISTSLDRPDKGTDAGSTASWRGRIATRLVRLVVKRWKRGDPPAVVRRARRVFGMPNPLSSLYLRSLKVEQVETTTVDGQKVRGEWLQPTQAGSADHVLLYLHGGGYVSCTPQTHRPVTCGLARLLKTRVFSLDYRLAPENTFPAAVDDATAAYQWLVASGVAPENIAVAGDSAGGGLAVATMLRLRAQGHALPVCVVCLSPWVDLTGADKYRNSGSCSMFQPDDISVFAAQYLNGASARSPEASPVFGDLHGLPPLLIQVSSTELLFDDSVRLNEKARSCGVASTLRIYPGLPHVWHILVPAIPEAGQALKEIADFIATAWHGPSRLAKQTTPLGELRG